MKYFIDTEFIEEPGSIELISIGIVAEDGREYYAISKDFNLKKAWNTYDKIYGSPASIGDYPPWVKNYWLRDNVCKNLLNNTIFNYYKEIDSYRSFKRLVNYFGKTNKQIAEEIKMFTLGEVDGVKGKITSSDRHKLQGKPEFYGYFADYDWVVFCWLFGRMIDLPSIYPKFCLDLKQMMVERQLDSTWKRQVCPDPKNEHNALSDARWNFKLYNELIKCQIQK